CSLHDNQVALCTSSERGTGETPDLIAAEDAIEFRKRVEAAVEALSNGPAGRDQCDDKCRKCRPAGPFDKASTAALSNGPAGRDQCDDKCRKCRQEFILQSRDDVAFTP